MAYFFDGKKHHLIDGMLVEDDALKIATAIKDYDPKLTLICADPTDPDVKFTSAPFMVVYETQPGIFEKVLEAWQLDDRILHRIWVSDYTKNDQLQIIEDMEARFKKEQEDALKEKQGDKIDMAVAALKNPKSSFSYHREETGDLITVNDHGPATVNKGKKSFSGDSDVSK